MIAPDLDYPNLEVLVSRYHKFLRGNYFSPAGHRHPNQSSRFADVELLIPHFGAVGPGKFSSQRYCTTTGLSRNVS